MNGIESMHRYAFFAGIVVLAVISLGLLFVSAWFWIPTVLFGALSLLGLYDITQTKHAVTRNYPVLGHLRFLLEEIRPEIRQYLIESDQDESPFSREERSLVYQRAKGVEDKRPFGTQQKIYEAGYAWLTHSIVPTHLEIGDFRVRIGGPDCKQPYDASLYNISAMSFGSLSANAILALNKGAKMGGFAHDTGEGGVSRYHREGGGDLIYEIG
ncbi:MAG: glutamate synthase-related protein, partial [Pseudomonadota bacterium]